MQIKKNLAVVAVAGLIFAAAGTTGAVAGDLIGSNDIKDDSVKSKDIKNDTIKQRDLSEGLKDKVNRTEQGPAGPRGPQGPTGPQGPAGTNANIDAMLAGEDATWTANGASSFAGYTVTLVDGTAAGTSVEGTGFNHPVQAGDMISFEFSLKDGADCNGGAPRMFVTIDGTTTNSWDQNIDAGEQCGEPTGEVVFTAPGGGTITDVGFVYDNGNPGTVYITDVLVDGLPVFLG